MSAPKSNTHYVCLDCRVCFKRTCICPHCKKEMKDFGKKFKAPKKTNDTQWKKLELWSTLPYGHKWELGNIHSYSESKIKCEKVLDNYTSEDSIIKMALGQNLRGKKRTKPLGIKNSRGR